MVEHVALGLKGTTSANGKKLQVSGFVSLVKSIVR